MTALRTISVLPSKCRCRAVRARVPEGRPPSGDVGQPPVAPSQHGDVPGRAAWWAITIDCIEPRRLASFWSDLFGCAVAELGTDRPGWLRLQPLGSNGPFINFQPVKEPRVSKVRIHVDVLVDDIEPAVEHVVALGGADTGAREELPRGRIAVMRDPEGNEFCLLAPPAS
jgi:predicted enzyme related to lactoylglutathione lyase